LDGRKCFKCQGYGNFQADCPNRRVLTLIEIEEIDHLTSELVEEEIEDEETATVLTPDVGELFVLQRILHAKEGPREENQREHIFHSRCTVQGKVCSLIIDGGSCTNIASTHLVSKLALTTIRHPRPYALQWLKKANEVHVTKQTLISFSIGHLRDEVLCDVLPMDACHLLLGRPWQYDRDVIHNGKSNTYCFKLKGRNYTLTPLLPSQVKPIQPLPGEGNTSEKALFLSETRVERSINKGKNIFALFVLEKGEGETPLHTLANH